MVRSIRTIILLLVISPLILSFNFFKKHRDYGDMGNELIAKVAKKLTKKHNMDWIGIGSGMMKNVEMLGLSFQIHHLMNRDEARACLVDCVEELLKAVNENKEIRPFLKNYPFTTKNVEIVIFINDNDREIYDPNFRVISLSESDDIYFSTVGDPKSLKYKNRYRESYQEALAKVRGIQQPIDIKTLNKLSQATN